MELSNETMFQIYPSNLKQPENLRLFRSVYAKDYGQ